MCPLCLTSTACGLGDKNLLQECRERTAVLPTSHLLPRALEQNQEYGYDIIADQLQSMSAIRNQNREMSSKEADDLYSDLPAQLQKAVD